MLFTVKIIGYLISFAVSIGLGSCVIARSCNSSSKEKTEEPSLSCYEIHVMQDGDDYQGYVQFYTIDENGDLNVCYQMQPLKEGVAEYSIREEGEYLIRIYDKDKNVVELETVYTTPIEYSVIEIEIPTE